MLDFMSYLRQMVSALIADSPESSKSYETSRKINMSLAAILETENHEILRSCFAFMCFLRARLDISLPKSPRSRLFEDTREADEALDTQVKSINQFFTSECLAWAKGVDKFRLHMKRASAPFDEQAREIEKLLKEDCLVWTKKCNPKRRHFFVYWNTAAAWRELWEEYSNTSTSCSSGSGCMHRQNFGLLESLLLQTHAETRRMCMLAVGNRLPVELVNVIHEFTLLAEGAPIDNTTCSEVEVIYPDSDSDGDKSPFSRIWRDYSKPHGPTIEKRLHEQYQCELNNTPDEWHNLFR